MLLKSVCIGCRSRFDKKLLKSKNLQENRFSTQRYTQNLEHIISTIDSQEKPVTTLVDKYFVDKQDTLRPEGMKKGYDFCDECWDELKSKKKNEKK